MTEQQAEKLGHFIDKMPEKESTIMFEELVAAMSLYFGTIVYSELIESVYDNLAEKGQSIEQIAEEVKKLSPAAQDIYADLAYELGDEDKAWQFAENAVESVVFNPEFPKAITDEVAKMEVDMDDFSANLILSFKDAFLDLFVNELEFDEWKSDVIDALVASWN